MRNRPSMTAQAVATNIVYLSQNPQFGVVADAEGVATVRALMQDIKGRYGRAVRMSDNRFYRWYLPAIEKAFLPGISLHQTLRKRWIGERVRDGLREGARQVVALGAGFDPLLILLHRRHPDVRFYEIDHPATQAPKRAATEREGWRGSNLNFLPADFTQTTLAEVLASVSSYDPTTLTLFIAEGVLMYLSEEEVRTLLRIVHTHSASGSRLVGTLMEPDPPTGNINMRGGNRTVSRIVEATLNLIGEPLRWGIAPAPLQEFLASEQFELMATTTTGTVLKSALPLAAADTRLPEGEYLFECKKMR